MYHDSNGLGTKYALASEDGWPQYGINGEPTSSGILTTHGGCVKFQVDFRGRIAHVSRSRKGADALAAARRRVPGDPDARQTHEPYAGSAAAPRFLVGTMHAGTAPGAVPDRAERRATSGPCPARSGRPSVPTWSGGRAGGARTEVTAQVRCLVRQRAFVGPRSGVLFDALSAGAPRVRGIRSR